VLGRRTGKNERRGVALSSQKVLVWAVPAVKTAVAASLSWWLAVLLFGAGLRPYFAPLAAILSMQVTVYETLAYGAQRILGVIGGVALSLLLVHLLRAGPLAVGLLVLLGTTVSSLLGFRARAATQVGVSGLLVMALGAKPDYAAARLIETVLGALVGVAVQALLLPPDPTPAALEAVAAFGRTISQELGRLSRREQGERSERVLALARQAAEAQAAVALARQSLRLNPLRQGRARMARRLEIAFGALERAAIEVRGMGRSLRGGEAEPLRRVAADAVFAAREAVAAFVREVEGRDPQGAVQLRAALDRLHRANSGALTPLGELGRGEVLREAGSLLTDLERLREDIRAAAHSLEGGPPELA